MIDAEEFGIRSFKKAFRKKKDIEDAFDSAIHACFKQYNPKTNRIEYVDCREAVNRQYWEEL